MGKWIKVILFGFVSAIAACGGSAASESPAENSTSGTSGSTATCVLGSATVNNCKVN